METKTIKGIIVSVDEQIAAMWENRNSDTFVVKVVEFGTDKPYDVWVSVGMSEAFAGVAAALFVGNAVVVEVEVREKDKTTYVNADGETKAHTFDHLGATQLVSLPDVSLAMIGVPDKAIDRITAMRTANADNSKAKVDARRSMFHASKTEVSNDDLLDKITSLKTKLGSAVGTMKTQIEQRIAEYEQRLAELNK